jgi:hypothetical protein
MLLVLAMGLSSRLVLAQGTATGISFQIFDSATGFGVRWAQIKWSRIGHSSVPPLSQSAVSSPEGMLPLRLSPGEYAFEISASGYKPARTYDSVGLGPVFRSNVVLDPIVQPEELRETKVAGELRKGMELDHGFVSDALTHRPIAQAELKLQQSGATATANSRGYFQFLAPAQDTSKSRSAEEFPPSDTLTASAPGYKTYILTGLWHDPESWRVINIELRPGTGVMHEDAIPGALLPRGAEPQSRPASKSSPTPGFLLRWLSRPATKSAVPDQQPGE